MTRRGMMRASASFGLYVTVILGVPLFAVAALVTGQIFDADEITSNGYVLLAGAGILHFLVGRYCGFRAGAAIGANRNQPLLTTSILYSVILAIIVLDESITWAMFGGMALVVVGPMLMIERSRVKGDAGVPAKPPTGLPASGLPSDPSSTLISGDAVATAAKPDAKPDMPPLKMAEGYFFGLAAAAIYGNTPIMVRAALEDSELGIMGGLASYQCTAPEGNAPSPGDASTCTSCPRAASPSATDVTCTEPPCVPGMG